MNPPKQINTNSSEFSQGNSDISLLDLNIKLNEVINFLVIKKKQLEEYNALLNTSNSNLSKKIELLQIIINGIEEPVEIFDTNFKVIFQNEPSINELGNMQNRTCKKFFVNSLKACNNCKLKNSTDGEVHISKILTVKGQLYRCKIIPTADEKIIIVREKNNNAVSTAKIKTALKKKVEITD